jgi:RimJ/RimL family protein N-acetyltransferase
VTAGTVRLADGRVLGVRPAGAADVPGIVALFDRLSPDDRYRRFFSGFHPDEAFVRALVERPAAEGVLLVVEASAPDGPEIVAEAEYAVSADGGAELAMTVDRRWRGWLAPFLLDALLQHACDAGIPNLRADVLAQNRAMLALLRSRGCAMAESGDPCTSEVVVGSAGTAPGWAPGAPRPRVALEASGSRWRLMSKLREAGVPVLRCAGPASRPANVPCPVLEGAPCPLVEGADVVLHALGREDPRCAAVLDVHRSSGAPVVEVAEDSTAEEVEAIVLRLLDAEVGDRGG